MNNNSFLKNDIFLYSRLAEKNPNDLLITLNKSYIIQR